MVFFILYSVLCVMPLFLLLKGAQVDFEIPLILWVGWIIWFFRSFKNWGNKLNIILEKHQLKTE